MHPNKKIGFFFSLKKSLDSTANLHPTASSGKNSLSQQLSFSPTLIAGPRVCLCKLHWALFRALSQQVDDELIGGEHYSRVGNLPDKLWNESSVKSSVALLHCHQTGRLEKVFVFAALFSQSCPNDLWKKTRKRRVSDHSNEKKRKKPAELKCSQKKKC